MLKIDNMKEVLFQKYIVEHKTIHTVAEEMGISVGSTYNWLKRFGIETRKVSDYEATEKQRKAWSKIGKSRKGAKLSEEQRQKLSQACKGRMRKKSKYGGYIKKRGDGYIQVFVPTHPHCNSDGLVMEHRLVVEEQLGRYLEKDEVVHHINHKRNDNRPENLQLMTFSEHARMHLNERMNFKNKKEGMTY